MQHPKIDSASNRRRLGPLSGVHALVVDDRSTDLMQYAAWLALAGAHVEGARTLAEAESQLEAHFDVVIVDRLLPDGEGFRDLVQRASTKRPRAHIVTSGHFPLEVYQEIDRSTAVPAGKDGLVAPWVLVSIVQEACRRAHVQLPQDAEPPAWLPAPGASSLSRTPWTPPWEHDAVRHEATPSGVVVVPPVSVDEIIRSATVFGRPLSLRPKEIAVLAHLMRNKGRAVSQQELLESVWKQHHDPKNAVVRNQIASLRRALGLGTAFIQTAPGGKGWGIALHGSSDAQATAQDAVNS